MTGITGYGKVYTSLCFFYRIAFHNHMKFYQASLQTCSQATGAVVVIDVIRAFTTAAFAFAAGAESIVLVSTVEEAVVLRNQIPDSLISGEVGGLPPEEFDFGNSPTEFVGIDLKNRRLIQRTSSGTQGVVKSSNAEILLTASFCNAQATVDYLKSYSPESVTFVATGFGYKGLGAEDVACAQYLESLMKDMNTDPEPFLKIVRESKASRYFADPKNTMFKWQDIEYCTEVDRFNFAMVVSLKNGRLVMIPVSDAQNLL